MRYYKFGRPQLQPSFNHKDPGMKSRFENYCNQLGLDQVINGSRICTAPLHSWNTLLANNQGGKTQALIFVV